ncbi:MAG: hypothetical protein AAF757_19365 [Cyanobacteria bacterium P01_D01_bin.116]
MNVPRFQKFLEATEAVKTQLHIGNTPLEVKSQFNQKLKQPKLILPPAFSYINFLMIQILSETGYGELNITIEKKNNEFVVCIKNHLSQRYLLNEKESDAIHKAYLQIIKDWSNWWLSKCRY